MRPCWRKQKTVDAVTFGCESWEQSCMMRNCTQTWCFYNWSYNSLWSCVELCTVGDPHCGVLGCDSKNALEYWELWLCACQQWWDRPRWESLVVAVAVWVTEFSWCGTVPPKHRNGAFMAVILRKGGGSNEHFGTSERAIWRKATAGCRPLLWGQRCDFVCCTGMSAQCSIYRGLCCCQIYSAHHWKSACQSRLAPSSALCLQVQFQGGIGTGCCWALGATEGDTRDPVYTV